MSGIIAGVNGEKNVLLWGGGHEGPSLATCLLVKYMYVFYSVRLVLFFLFLALHYT